MVNLVQWIKRNKLTFLVLVVVGWYLARNWLVSSPMISRDSSFGVSGGLGGLARPELAMDAGEMTSSFLTNKRSGISMPPVQVPPAPQGTERMVVLNTSLALAVEDVTEAINSTKVQVESVGGYVINTDVTRPEEGGLGTISFRVLAERLAEITNFLKENSVTVVSESQYGTDVTDQYVDNDERLRILTENKARLEEIMASAEEVEDILEVQERIFSLQSQIDAITGSQKYLEETSRTVLVTATFSTDEYALPYSPTEKWRPEVVFKTAVRSLVMAARNVGSLIIWVLVYGIVWLPLLVLYLIYKRRKGNGR